MEQKPTNPNVWLIALTLLSVVALWPAARREFARQTEPPRSDLDAATQASREGHYPEAVAAAERYLRQKPDSPEGLLALGNAYAAQRRWDEAILAAQQSLVSDPHFVPGWTLLNDSLQRRAGEHPTAESLFHSALQLYNSGVFPGCVDLSSRALTLQPGYTQAHWLNGICQLKLGHAAEAATQAQAVLAVNPQHDGGRHLLAEALTAQPAK